jgi:Asp/Glu/Hydantoin racemase
VTGHQPLVALVHATPAAMAPAAAAFADSFPEARLWNLLDDTLINDAERAGGLTSALRARMRTLIGYAAGSGADAVLLSCSMYGPVADEAAPEHTIPVLPSDGPLFAEVARLAPSRVHVLGPIEAGTLDTIARLRDHLSPETVVCGTAVVGARDALATGDVAEAVRLVTDAARAAAHPADGPGADLILLGQFSLAPTLTALQASLDIPVLSPPHLAARAIRTALTAGVGA